MENETNGPARNDHSAPKDYKILPEETQEISKVSDIDFSRTYSYADYFRWQFEDRLELIRGKVFRMSPVPSSTHQRLCGLIYVKLYEYLSDKTCEAFISPFDVRLPVNSAQDEAIFTVVQPDICVVCDPGKIDERGCLGAPDVVVEILSPGNNSKELIIKHKIYEEAGVKEYWIVNPEKKIIIVYAINGKGKYQEVNVAGTVNNNLSLVFPDFQLCRKDLCW